MKGITWSRDSHGLFDYESRHLTKKTMKTNQPSQIIRKNNELELLPIENGIPPFKKTNQNDDQENRPLVNIINENGKYDEDSRKFEEITRYNSITLIRSD